MALGRLPDRAAFFREGAGAFYCVFGCLNAFHDWCAEADGVLNGLVLPPVNYALYALDGQWPAEFDLLGYLVAFGEKLGAVLYEVLDQPDLVGTFRANPGVSRP